MKNEKLLFAAVAVFGLILSHLLSGVKLPSGYDLGVVFTWVSVAGLVGFVAQFMANIKYNDDIKFTHGYQGIDFYHEDGTPLIIKTNNLHSTIIDEQI